MSDRDVLALQKARKLPANLDFSFIWVVTAFAAVGALAAVFASGLPGIISLVVLVALALVGWFTGIGDVLLIWSVTLIAGACGVAAVVAAVYSAMM